MRIAPIMNYSRSVQVNTSPKNYQTLPVKSEVSFGYGWNAKKLNILNANSTQLQELGEYFHKFSSEALKDVATIRNGVGLRKTESSRTAYCKLKGAVDEVLKVKNEWLERISQLSVKEAKNEENITSEKLRVTNLFINMLDSGNVDNGIIIHGTSRKKQEFLDWLLSVSGINIKEMTFDPKNSAESLGQLIVYAENAKTAKAINGKRTLLNVNNLDELLTNFDTAAGRRNLAKFKSFSEVSAQNYETTLVTTTNHLLEDFEDASIAPHRMGLKVKLTEHLTDAERKELDTLRAQVSELDKKADQARLKFYDEIPEAPYEEEQEWWKDPVEVYWRQG